MKKQFNFIKETAMCAAGIAAYESPPSGVDLITKLKMQKKYGKRNRSRIKSVDQ